MFKLLFICHGNICRSPMAESVCSYLIEKKGLQNKILVSSAATHTDEIGNSPHYGTRKKLLMEGIPLVPHHARLMTSADGDYYDLLIGMDEYNVRDMKRIVGKKNANKVKMLLDFTDFSRPIADPWYTGNFEETYRDIVEGCTALLDYVLSHDITF